MVKLVLLILINLILLNSINCEILQNLTNCAQLKTLFIIHRHGDRTTEYNSSICKTDVNLQGDLDLRWPDGIGELTKKGKNRMFNIGRYLRKKYRCFLGDDVREVMVRSSDVGRCIESAKLVVNGLFNENLKNKSISFLPVAVHTKPIESDSMLYPSSYCPSSNLELSKIFNNEYGSKVNKTFQKLYKYLSDKCETKVETNDDIYRLNDLIMNEILNNLTLPNYINKDIVNQLNEGNKINFNLISYTRKIQRLRTGVFLNDLFEKIEKSIKNSNKKILNDDQEIAKKIYIYSSHDSLITYILASLGIFNQIPPYYGSTLLLELYVDNKNRSDWQEISSLKINYLNETEKLYELKIANCKDKERCSVKEFKKSVDDLIIDESNWEIECGLKMESNNLNINIDLILSIVTLIIVILINLFLSFCIFCPRKRSI